MCSFEFIKKNDVCQDVGHLLLSYHVYRMYGTNINTLQPLYNTVRYNTVLDIIRFKDGSQKCIDYIEK